MKETTAQSLYLKKLKNQKYQIPGVVGNSCRSGLDRLFYFQQPLRHCQNFLYDVPKPVSPFPYRDHGS